MPPQRNTQELPHGIELIQLPDGQNVPSPQLKELLCEARSNYDWPAGTGANINQQTIINLVEDVATHLHGLNPNSAQAIVIAVSEWAGNNTKAHAAIVNATGNQKADMYAAIINLCHPGQEAQGLDSLSNFPGISLVIASKIFRFCVPQVGAAVDRHASYFFNSIPVIDNGFASNFIREWTNGRHTSSRLAIYNQRNYINNRTEYIEKYLPMLSEIAEALNADQIFYICAATNQERSWTPADVEMAAYYWWATNGAR